MNIRRITAKTAAATLPLLFATTAHAQQMPAPAIAPSAPVLTYTSGSHEMWHSVLLISGIFLLVGLVDNDSGLTILGGAGVLVALSETNGTAYRFVPAQHGVDLLQMGHVSLGVDPFGFGFTQENRGPKPGLILQAKFKF